MSQELKEKTGCAYTGGQLCGKYNRCKDLHKRFLEVLNHTGVTFNAETNKAIADDEVWESFFKKNKIFRTLYKQGCKHYEMYCLIFGNNYATGGLANPSTQQPVNSNEERQNEDNFIMTDTDNLPRSCGNSSKGKRSADEMTGSGKMSVNKNWRNELASAFVSYNSIMSEDLHDRREERKEKKLRQQHRQHREESASEMSTGMTHVDSMTRSVQILNTFSTLSSEAYNHAFEKLATSEAHRNGFIAMPEDRRLAWLLSL
ncbi:PREDICTED: uncharacterized protein LOC109184104 [Ipomoea nil]|nr:PREDICTED: uncharacterized protein LOC109184104 [Ipomoea nil]